MELIDRYFEDITQDQRKQFDLLLPLYTEWNDKINVISRKDIENLYLHHVLHSLSIAALLNFKDKSHIIDLGCGGGFPGIPLAIFFPEVRFTLIDGTRKKITVVNAVAEALHLQNVQGIHTRAEDYKGEKADFVVSRAVAEAGKIAHLSRKLIHLKHNNPIPNGLILLKGGDLKEEFNSLPRGFKAEKFKINDFFKEEYFEEKYLVFIPF